MKYAVFIVILSLSHLHGQVGPPDLRCLEVLPNGDVKLSWLPPNGNTATFSYYEIWSGISPAGPFAMLTTTVAPVNTTTFVHTAATASAQSRYYYMVSRYNNASAASVPSNTLKTIFLNINAGYPALQLTYNNIHLPPLPSASSNFTITKEYPIGSVNNLAILSDTKYADTIDVCRAKMNYQVGLADQSGCISLSNLILGEYNDTKEPDSTRVDSISVLENGNTILAWQIPKDKDIISYRIIENVSINNYVDSLPGRQNTFYIYSNTLANTRPVRLYVNAVDSCQKIGNFDETPETMFLETEYDHCAYRTRLRWNAYKGLRGGVREYWIYYSVNGSAYQRIGAATSTSFVHNGTEGSANICYFVRVVNNDQSITASSNRSCFFSSEVAMPAFLYLQSADVVSTRAVNLRLHLDDSKPVSGIDILRSNGTSAFGQVGFIPYNGTAYYEFTDTTAQTGNFSYAYRAQFRDSCGNTRTVSNTARTILLRVNEDAENIFRKNLSWNEYEGFSGGVEGYNIFRYVDEQPANSVLATTGPGITTYEDNLEEAASSGAKIVYRVQAVEGAGNIYGMKEISHSNTVQVFMEGSIFIPNAFAPSGINTTWKPVTHFIDKTEYRVRVFNRWGKMVFETTDESAAWDGANCIEGVYAYLVNYRNSRGEYMERKGSIMLLR